MTATKLARCDGQVDAVQRGDRRVSAAVAAVHVGHLQ